MDLCELGCVRVIVFAIAAVQPPGRLVPIAPVWRRLLVIRSLSPSIGLAVGRAREPRGLAQSLTGSQEIAVLYRIRTVDTTS